MHPTAVKRGLTIAAVAIGSALLIAALAVAMRGLAPTASKASDQPGQAVRTLHRPAHRVMRRLASWHAPRVPKAHRRKVVVTVVAPSTVVPAPPSSAATTTAAPPSTETQGGTDDEHDDASEPEPGDE
jgi:hypothetical protein